MQLGLRQFGTHAPAQPRQNGTPDTGADERKHTEFHESHPDNAGWNGDQMANDRQQPRKENPARFVAAHKDLGPGELIGRHQEILAPAEHCRPAEPSGHHIHDGGSEPGSERPRYDHANEGHSRPLLRGSHDRGRWNHHLARNWNDSALQGHEPKDSRISAGLHPVEPDFNKMMHEKVSDLGF